MAKNITKNLRRLVKERALGCCEYCMTSESFSPDSFSIEHIQPSSKGGTNLFENLAFACLGCNWAKGSKTEVIDSQTQKTTPLFNPRKQIWKTHFRWENQFEILGTTKIGRTTVDTLKLNRVNLINLRFALAVIGFHPPKHSL